MRSLLRFLSRISIRLLAFNVLLVFLPFFGFLLLQTYELELRELQEDSMVQQGRLLAAALAEGGALEAVDAERILTNMNRRFDARLRVIDSDLRLLADSSRLGPRRESEPDAEKTEAEGRESWMYRLGSFLYRGFARLFLPPEPPFQESDLYATAERLDGGEIQDALEGRYGATYRRSPITRSVVLYSAIPIRSDDEVVGVVLVSKSTFGILRAIYDLRLSTFQVVLASVAVAVVLSLLVATTIARPLQRLRKESKALLDRRGRLKGSFKGSRRLDEIGDLSRALAELTRRLEGHIHFIESFASDVSHEFKNPLASIRNATELVAEIDDPAERERFIGMVLSDIARLEYLLAGVREITRIDAEIDDQPTEPVELEKLLAGLIERYESRPSDGATYRLGLPATGAVVEADPERLSRVFENLLDNAVSFSPEKAEIDVDLEVRAKQAVVEIRDHGPGIPDEHLEKIFARFFSYRHNGSEGDGHTGLGLAIVKAIVESYGGDVRASNHPEGGAVFETALPLKR
ncbi:MAG: GHKL domain-containing protein [bacterium]|nr:GHKL domain-containing protein [bacterium]